ncbi:MAG TPA: D-alanyl-D-alanine carboxypeptidase/D-alanyl-D-alanine-endopeptidase [Pyrinomonadaceae bacterium]|nr:D-alanyl-D-alanine carboxypeptidase/D-alanyl-D-alanine-endopeptidase [Pyrinomonadaceae bacterium]
MNSRTISVLLLFIFIISGVPPATAGYQQQRERKAAPAPVAQATPTPPPGQPPQPTPEQEAEPVSTPGPRTASTTRTLGELQSRISEILRKPEFSPALIAIKVASLDTGRVLFEDNSHKLVRPASNMKLYTVAAALDRLSPDFHFVTSVYAQTKPDEDGVIKGDLIIYGRGDPSLAARFNNGDYFKGIDDLATRIAASGLKRLDGNLIGDETYFSGSPYGSGWEWGDLTWYYGAEVSSLAVNDNALDLFVKPGTQVGSAALVTTGPPDPLLTIVNRVTTAAKGTRRSISVYRSLGENRLELSGTIPVDDHGYTGGVGISHPAQLFMSLLRSALGQHGIKVKGQTQVVSERTGVSLIPKGSNPPSQPAPIEIAKLQSPPFATVAAQTLKPSQNLYTEIILRTLGEVAPVPATATSSVQTSEDAGHDVVKAFLKEAGLNPDSLVLSDGSGLSRNDMITVDSNVQLLTYMSKHKYAAVWRDALPIAGVDGTLRNRLRNTPAENNLRAKTGSLSSAASLSGYVTSAAGENLVFSIVVNNYTSDAEPRAACIDPIAVLLASFAGRSM